MYNNGNTSKNVTGASVVDGTIANADIDSSAAIATSKLSGAVTSITSHGLSSSATTDTTDASNIGSGTLSNDRLSLDISNSDVNASAEIAQSKLATLVITDSEVADNELSGDKIDGGTISNFTSTGIDDNATSEHLQITDSGIDVTGKVGSISSTAEQAQFSGWSATGANGASGAIRLGNNASWQGKIDYAADANTTFTHENTYSSGIFNWKIAGSEKVRILSSGGITFNGDTAAANALDDYEEGTWTPSYNCSTTPPTVSYTARLGYYTKVGRLVHIKGFIQVSSMSSVGTGTVTITGLPFTSQNIPSGSGSIGYCSQFTSTGSPITIIVAQNGTTLTPNKTTSSDARSGTYISCSASDLSTSGGYMYFTAGYYA